MDYFVMAANLGPWPDLPGPAGKQLDVFEDRVAVLLGRLAYYERRRRAVNNPCINGDPSTMPIACFDAAGIKSFAASRNNGLYWNAVNTTSNRSERINDVISYAVVPASPMNRTLPAARNSSSTPSTGPSRRHLGLGS